MADMTAAQWATLVLQDYGAPVTQNNLDNMLAWMASENTWPPPRNNPLNNGLGSGGGSGLGSYPSLEVAAQYAASGIRGGITGAAGIGQALAANAPFSTFHQATISATWSGDHYAGTGWASATSPQSMGVSGAATPGIGPGVTPALASAAAEGGTAYLEALYNASKPGTPGAASGPAAAATSSTDINGTAYQGTAQQTSALSTIETNLQQYGFNPTQVSQLTNWAWGEITNNVDPSQIAIDLQNQPAFIQQFPYFHDVNNALIAQGQQPLAPADYMGLTKSYEQAAQAGGLPAGMLTQEDMATLMKGNVSANELSDRINTAISYTLSTPAAQSAFNLYFGAQDMNQPMTPGDWTALAAAAAMPGGAAYLKAAAAAKGTNTPLTLGQMAAIVLDPTKAEPLLQQQLTTAQIGGASVTSGLGALDAATATQLAQAGITLSQATNAFQQIAPLSALETPRPGMGAEAAQGTVSAEQLALGNLLGNPADQRQQQQAVEVAKAPFAGGGGFVSTSKGAAVGSANPNGTGNT